MARVPLRADPDENIVVVACIAWLWQRQRPAVATSPYLNLFLFFLIVLVYPLLNAIAIVIVNSHLTNSDSSEFRFDSSDRGIWHSSRSRLGENTSYSSHTTISSNSGTICTEGTSRGISRSLPDSGAVGAAAAVGDDGSSAPSIVM